MLIPINTDAPVYHFPTATIGLIGTNIVAFVITGIGFREDLADPWILWFGDGLHPLQWLTACFMHADIAHLIGNMIFLWAFGLVVEGKIGWKIFLPLYLAMGMFQSGLEQCIMLGADREAVRQQQAEDWGIDLDNPAELPAEKEPDLGQPAKGAFWNPLQDLNLPPDDVAPLLDDDEEDRVAEDDDDAEVADDEPIDDFEIISPQQERIREHITNKGPIMYGALGASGVIYSLVAMSLVWAPKNEMTILALLGFRVFTFEIAIMYLSICYIGLDFLIALATQLQMSSSFLHLMGAITGFGVGVLMLKKGMVDCEDWDLFAVLSGNYGPHVRDIYGYRTEKGKKTKFDEPEETEVAKPKKNKTKSKLNTISELIAAENPLAAAEELMTLRIRQPNAALPEEDLRELARQLVAEKEFEDAEPVLEEYIELHPETANWACLRLSAIQLQVNGRPREAMRTLRNVHKESLTAKEKETGRKISQAAKKLIADGVPDREPEW